MDSIIFDLDGTIWDSCDTVALAWNSVFKQNKHVNKEVTKNDVQNVMGLQTPEIGKKLFPKLDADTREQLMMTCGAVENKYIEQYGGKLYEYVEDALKKLSKKYSLYIVSNCQDGYIEAFYTYHQLEKYFSDYENPGRTGLSKAENILLIMKRNQLSNPVYVGDTIGDGNAAKIAGIPFIYAQYGFGKAIEFDHVIENFSQLLELFE